MSPINIKISKKTEKLLIFKVIRYWLLIFTLNAFFPLFAQDSTASTKEEYYRKEEILHEGKRYRIHNNYLTAGGGYMYSSMRSAEQRAVGFDLHFCIYGPQHIQLGGMMSGPYFLGNNNTQGHFGYGLRKENFKTHFAAYAGLTYFTGVTEARDSANNVVPYYYQGVGVYASAQAVTKISYDIGLGLEVYAETSKWQTNAGFKLILFFSGAYRGPKRNYNPNVRSERAR